MKLNFDPHIEEQHEHLIPPKMVTLSEKMNQMPITP